MIHQPTAEELRLEQRRKDVQKWLTEGSYSKQSQPFIGNTKPFTFDDPLILWAQEQFQAIGNWAGEIFGAKSEETIKKYISTHEENVLGILFIENAIYHESLNQTKDATHKPITVYTNTSINSETSESIIAEAGVGIELGTPQYGTNIHASIDGTGFGTYFTQDNTTTISDVGITLSPVGLYWETQQRVGIGENMVEVISNRYSIEASSAFLQYLLYYFSKGSYQPNSNPAQQGIPAFGR